MSNARVMISAPSSGSGKTVTACALMAGFKQLDYEVRGCKTGPDYIDTMFHRVVLGVDSENLDLFFLSEDELNGYYQEHTKGADLTIVEGAMGYYDGMSLGSSAASAYHVGQVLDMPVILVLPCKGMAASALAILKGMIEFKEDSRIKGIILNQISPMLYPRMKDMVEQGLEEMGHGDVKVVGFLPKDEAFGLESRHLGLVTPAERERISAQMKLAGEKIRETVDLDAIYTIAASAPELPKNTLVFKTSEESEPVKVAVADDDAMCFYYKENLDCLRRFGCELVSFSPTVDPKLPDGCKGLIIGGGYPELYAKELSENTELRMELKEKISKGFPCLAECGGFMYLLDEMEDAEGEMHPMVSLLEGRSENKGRLTRFGYVTIEAKEDGAFLKAGERIKGHEFHYWDSTNNGDACIAVKPDGKRQWDCIHMEQNLIAGYPHLYYPSNQELIRRFVEACRKQL